MDNEERRKNILDILRKAQKSVTGTALAEKFGVSRQIVVGDIALLRAKGLPIVSTPRGYSLQNQDKGGVKETFVCRHDGALVEAELLAVVDNGGCVHNVIVEHEIYGFLEGQLNLRSRRDVELYMAKMRESHAPLLSSISNGIHTHLVETRTAEEMQAVRDALQKLGVLYQAEK